MFLGYIKNLSFQNLSVQSLIYEIKNESVVITNKSEIDLSYNINGTAFAKETKIKLDSKETLNLYLNLKANSQKIGRIIIDRQKLDIDLSNYLLYILYIM